MARIRLRWALLAIALAAIITAVGGILYGIARLYDPVVVVVSNDPSIALTKETVLAHCDTALRKVGLEPDRAILNRDGDPESVLSRNALRPEDRVTVHWFVRGKDRPTYSVVIERSATNIIAEVYRNK